MEAAERMNWRAWITTLILGAAVWTLIMLGIAYMERCW